jgi:hypothetical protein
MNDVNLAYGYVIVPLFVVSRIIRADSGKYAEPKPTRPRASEALGLARSILPRLLSRTHSRVKQSANMM